MAHRWLHLWFSFYTVVEPTLPDSALLSPLHSTFFSVPVSHYCYFQSDLCSDLPFILSFEALTRRQYIFFSFFFCYEGPNF